MQYRNKKSPSDLAKVREQELSTYSANNPEPAEFKEFATPDDEKDSNALQASEEYIYQQHKLT